MKNQKLQAIFSSILKNKSNFVLILLSGILLLVIALPVGKSGTGAQSSEKNAEESIDNTCSQTIEDSYREEMEKELEEILSSVKGAGQVRVLLTLQAGEEQVLKADADTGTVFIKEGSNSTPYVVKTITPRVEGVIILAQGAGSGSVSMELMDAVRVLFGIEAHKIKVLKMEPTNP